MGVLSGLAFIYTNQFICGIEHMKDRSGEVHSHPLGHNHHDHDHHHALPDHGNPSEQPDVPSGEGGCCHDMFFCPATPLSAKVVAPEAVKALVPAVARYSELLPDRPFVLPLLSIRSHAPPGATNIRIFVDAFRV